MDTTTDSWLLYYRIFESRAERVPPDAFDRNELLYDAAHDAYQNATNELTEDGWDADHALMAGRLFSTIAKEWVDSGSRDMGALQEKLRAEFADWTPRAKAKQPL